MDLTFARLLLPQKRKSRDSYVTGVLESTKRFRSRFSIRRDEIIAGGCARPIDGLVDELIRVLQIVFRVDATRSKSGEQG